MSKRRRPETGQGLPKDEDAILNFIKAKKDSGVWLRDIKLEIKLPDPVITKSIKSLMTKKLIKEVVNYKEKAKKHYMAVEFEPSKEISGGVWYNAGSLDSELINVLKMICSRCVKEHKVATPEKIHSRLVKSGVVKVEISVQDVKEILNLMVLDDDMLEVKSSGLGEYYSIPVGTVCYRLPSGSGSAKGSRMMGAYASIPCGACPRINLCTPDGVISPKTCVYYTKWLDIDF